MPSRFTIALIFVFWFGSMTLLTIREVLPRYNVGEPPPFTIDMTDEVNTGSGAANWIDWTVLYQGKPVGSCNSAVRRLPDRTYELKTHYKFTDFNLFGIDLKKLQVDYVVSLEGKLRRVSILGKVSPDLEGVFVGEVVDGILRSYAVGRKGEMELLKSELPAVRISNANSILNTMHLQNRIRGLFVGRTWNEPLIDSFAAVGAALGVDLGKKDSTMTAEVVADAIEWNGMPDVECYRIDRREHGENVAARTWVRCRDDLVLKHEANFGGRELILLRMPPK